MSTKSKVSSKSIKRFFLKKVIMSVKNLEFYADFRPEKDVSHTVGEM
jgi:hypothetical protein